MENEKVNASHSKKSSKSDKEKRKKAKKIIRTTTNPDRIIQTKQDQIVCLKQLVEEACAALAIAFGETHQITERTCRMLDILKDRDQSLRWENKLADDELEEERIAVYKILRRYRYLRDVPQFDY